jgi:FAD/FMN-containing dehydrogenase
MLDLPELVDDVRRRGLAQVFATHGRELVASRERRPMLGKDLSELVRADPALRAYADTPAATSTPAAHRSGLTRRAFVGLAAAGMLESQIGVAHATAPRAVDHPRLREADGRAVQYVATEFRNWGRTVRNTPAVTFVPRTKHGVQEIVKWAAAHGRTVRAAGYRHTWTDCYSDDGQVLISTLPLEVVEHLPAAEPGIDPLDQLQGIEVVGTVEEDGVTKALCRIGAGTTNEQFRRWALDRRGGNWSWTVPLNVIMVEITWGGSTSQICHGAGRRNRTLSDLVAEVEFVNARGELQTVSDPELLKAAAGCFGMLGILTAVTLKLDPMTYATLAPKLPRLALAVPPLDPSDVPAEIHMTGITAADLDAAASGFESQCEDAYYAEWFWFPYQQHAWVNTWHNDGARKDAHRYPGPWQTQVQQTEEYLLQLTAETVFRRLPGRAQAEIFGALASANLPHDVTVVTPLIEALHFRRGIQNFRVLDMEFEIPVPPRADDPSQPDWSICRRAWWDAIQAVYARPDAPMRVALEMRVMGGSDACLAPEHGNDLGTCSIEVLTNLRTSTDQWQSFMQQVTDRWMSYTDPDGRPLNTRPHWAKQWEGLTLRGRPVIDHLRDQAYAARIPEFRAAMQRIAAQGGYPPSALRRFSNPLLDELFGAVFR